MNIFWDDRFKPDYHASPLVLVDVGARGGVQSRWNAAQKHLKVIGFEPEPEEHAKLSRNAGPNQLFLNSALFDSQKKIDLFVTKAPGRSSVFEPNFPLLRQYYDEAMMAGFEVVKKVEVGADTLDHQLAQHQISAVDFLKLDTQGAELAILRGGEKTLRESVIGLEVEVEFLPYYKNQPLFSDVQAYVGGLGFELFDLMPRYVKRLSGRAMGRRKGQLLYGDALFLKSPQAVLAMGERVGGKLEARRMILRALSLAALYGYLDYCADLLEKAREHFTEEESAAIRQELARSTPSWTKLPHFKGRPRLARVFYKLFRIFYPSPAANRDSGVTMSGYFLGNSDF